MNEQKQAILVRDFFRDEREGFFADVGAHAPRDHSLTWPLEQHGWRGILVEPQVDLCERLRAERPRSRVFQVACGAPEQRGWADFQLTTDPSHAGLRAAAFNPKAVVHATQPVEVKTLDDLLAEAGAERVDFVSIDVEGTELDVLRGFDLDRHRPALVLLEDVVDSLARHRYMKAHGYRALRRTGLNNWYVPRDGPRASLRDRAKLVRKLYVGLPTRKLEWWWRRRRARARATRP